VVVASDATATRDLPGAGGSPPVEHTSLQRAALAAVADRFADVMPAQQICALPLVRPAVMLAIVDRIGAPNLTRGRSGASIR
jgi:hypothetical protein